MFKKTLLSVLLIPFSLNAGRFTDLVNEPLQDYTIQSIAKRKTEINRYVFDKYTEYMTVSDMYLILSHHRAISDKKALAFHRMSEHYETKALLWHGAGQLGKYHVIGIATGITSPHMAYYNQFHGFGREKSLKDSMDFHRRILMKLKSVNDKIIPCDREDFYAAKIVINMLIKYESLLEDYTLKRYESARYHD